MTLPHSASGGPGGRILEQQLGDRPLPNSPPSNPLRLVLSESHCKPRQREHIVLYLYTGSSQALSDPQACFI